MKIASSSALLLLLSLAVPGWGQTITPVTLRIERAQNASALLLDLASAKPVSLEGIGAIQLSGAGGEFWAPFSLEDFKPIKANKTSRRHLDGPLKGQRIEFSSLLWGRMIDALWPFRPFSIVPSGQYTVGVVIEQNGNLIESNEVPLLLSGQEVQPYVWGDHLTPDALASAVKAATTDRGQPWAIRASHSQVLPETHYADTFLPPTVSSARFRRGIVQRFECRPAVRDADCADWKAEGEPKTYIQVADKAKFGASLIVRTSAERPIEVDGDFSDHDLISLVAFARSKPRFPRATTPDGGISGRIPDGPSGRYPVSWIRPDPHGVYIAFSEGTGIGEGIVVRRTRRGWMLVDAGAWVS